MDVHPPDISLVIPVYNEVESLEELAQEIVQVCENHQFSYEIWFIDDGSRDGSWQIIEALHQQNQYIHGVKFRRNYGKSAALAIGFEKVQGNYVITLDADLQDNPEEIPALINLLESGYDLVSGWKKRRKDPLGKKLPSKFFNYITRLISGIKLHDFNCGLKAYRSDVVKHIAIYGELHRYIPLLAKWEGYDRITEKVVNHRARKYGKTKFGFERYLRGFLDLITVFFLTRFAARPMHFFGSWGTFFFILGAGINGYLSLLKLSGHSLSNRPLLFLGILLIMLGAQMFFTGLLGEMLIKPTLKETTNYHITTEL